jgi:hypothetical protein
MMNPDKKLLREFIEETLKEDLGGDYAGLGFDGGMGGGYGMGGGLGSASGMYKAFIQPFVDVVQVTAGKTKELTNRAILLARVALEAIKRTFIPSLKNHFDDIFEEENAELDRIKNEYADAYASTWEVLKDADIAIMAFMYRPDLVLTALAAKSAPGAIARTLSVLSGGKLDLSMEKLKLMFKLPQSSGKHHKSTFDDHADSMGMGGGYGGGMGGYWGESVIREADDQVDDERIQKFVKNKKVRSIIMSNPDVQAIAKISQKLTRDTLNNVYDDASKVAAAKTFNDLKKIVPGFNIEQFNDLEGDERSAAETASVKLAKETMKSFYIQKLTKQVEGAIKSGVPEGHPWVTDYMATIAKIKQL